MDSPLIRTVVARRAGSAIIVVKKPAEHTRTVEIFPVSAAVAIFIFQRCLEIKNPAAKLAAGQRSSKICRHQIAEMKSKKLYTFKILSI